MIPAPLRALTRDGRILFGTRMGRMFAHGCLSVVLVLYLKELGLDEPRIGLLLTLTLLGDTIIALAITSSADRVGRRRMLILGALLMVLAAAAFASTKDFLLLLTAATIGVLSPSGSEVGPFLAIEQAALSQRLNDLDRTHTFAWYNLVGALATAIGALASGLLCQRFIDIGFAHAEAYRPIVVGYGIAGLLLALAFATLSPAIEADHRPPDEEEKKPRVLGLHRSRGVIARLSALFALDSFAGGFVLQSFVAYWFHIRFGVAPAVLGTIFFGANLVAAASSLAAVAIARRIGLLNTMVVTHLPSNILLMLIPLMPNLTLAITMLLLRFSISQMDVPTRQSYTMAVVAPDERSAASGLTGVARSIGAALSPLLVGAMFATPAWRDAPFFIAGTLKIAYDLLLYRAFKRSQSSLRA